jgi:hypothetical protein
MAEIHICAPSCFQAARLALDTASASALASRSSPNLAALASPRSAAILRGASDPGGGTGLGPRRSRSGSGGRAGGSGTMDVRACGQECLLHPVCCLSAFS